MRDLLSFIEYWIKVVVASSSSEFVTLKVSDTPIPLMPTEYVPGVRASTVKRSIVVLLISHVLNWMTNKGS